MSDTLSKAILKGHKPKYSVNDYKRTKKYNNLEELPTKESITYGRDSYDMYSTTYKYALIKRFLNRMVGKHIDEVYSEYKKTVINASHSRSLNNPFYYSQFEREYYFHNFIIDKNGLLKREEKKKEDRNPYYLSIGNLNCSNYVNKDYIYVQFKGKEYFHNKHAWHEITVTKRTEKVKIQFVESFDINNKTCYKYREVIHTEVKTRTLSNKEIANLNLNPVLSFPDIYQSTTSYLYNYNTHKLYKLPDNYK